MKSAAALVLELSRRGVRLVANGDRIHWEAPRGTVSAADLTALRERKAEVLAALRHEMERRRPRLGECGELVIPFDGDLRFRWWQAWGDKDCHERFRAAWEAAGVGLK
ncbi:MAG TPA: hypothetical protein VK714_00620 [Myxococcota bacterium]|nr:hypothetical protein [Myxococcota bacterium]